MKKLKFIYVDLILLFVAFVWGVNPVVVKVGLKYIPPLIFNSMRMIEASLFLWCAVLISGKYKKIDKTDVKNIIYLGVFGYFVYQVGFIIGIDNTTAGNTSLIVGLMPVSVAIINKIFKFEDMNIKKYIGIFLSFIGVMLIVFGSGKQLRISQNDIKGAIFLLVGQFGFAYYTVFSKPLLKKYCNIQISATFISIATILFIIINSKQLLISNIGEIPFKAYTSNIFSGIVSIGIGNMLWVWAIKKVGSVRTALYNNISPVFTIVIGILFLREDFGIIKFVGALIIFMGIYFTKLNTKKAVESGQMKVDS